mgnify:CR=1 FL=1
MSAELNQFINAGQQALQQQNWPLLEQISGQMLQKFPKVAQSHYLRGVVCRVKRDVPQAIDAFIQGLELDDKRYDIAVELANMYSLSRQNSKAAELLDQYVAALDNSPRFADLAGTIYTEIGLSDRALPLFKRAYELQPEAQIFKANLATCAVFTGDIDLGERLYRELIEVNPSHRKNHYQLARLKKAENLDHINQMLSVIQGSDDTARDLPIYFALGKEYEDLQMWEQSFEFYQKACDGVKAQTGHDVQEDIDLIDNVIASFDSAYLERMAAHAHADKKAVKVPSTSATPIFILGLPRTGTTLVERILSSHHDVVSVGETMFLQMAVRQSAAAAGGASSGASIDASVMKRLAEQDPRTIASDYMQSIEYRLGDEEFFIEKLPFNYLYTGLIAAAWPDARIVHLVRNPMDACFSMYKQVFTWAYKYSYSLQDLGRYYIAYDRLRQHWKSTLGDRFVEVSYESLVGDQEAQTRQLLEALELPFDEACLAFEKNSAPSATASSVQVRSKVHQGSVGKWRRYEEQLQPLYQMLTEAGIDLDSFDA